MSTADIRL